MDKPISAYMPLWVADWILDKEVAAMTAIQKACYIDLLCLNWARGSLPSSTAPLTALLPAPLRRPFMRYAWPALRHHFVEVEGRPGEITNKRLKVERDKAFRLYEAHRRGAEKVNAKRTLSGALSVTLSGSPSPSPSPSPSSLRDDIEGPKGPSRKRRPFTEADAQEVIKRWNALTERYPHLPRIEKLSDSRKQRLRCRLRDYPEWWALLEAGLEDLKPYHREGGWLSFDWLTECGNWLKFVEGNYRERHPHVALKAESSRELQEEIDAALAKDFTHENLDGSRAADF